MHIEQQNISSMKKLAFIFIAILSGALAGGISGYLVNNPKSQPEISSLTQNNDSNKLESSPARFVNHSALPYVNKEINNDFIQASEKARPAVVFIKAIQNNVQRSYSYWDLFFDFFIQPGPITSQGSGVIISPDGYIVTNNHVIEKADRIEVVVEGIKKSFKATIVGTAPSTDIALLKIEAENLPYIEFANSDELKIGEWVLAVGNPYNLTSTVTSGIVSAKGRNINILQKNNFPIESFIQTDAAINPGNSGGALVNLEGKLVGINTAILSKTGSYAGYGFAIPSNIVLKIVDDFRKYGSLQRAFLEAEYMDIDEQIAEKIGNPQISGIYISGVTEGGNADKAGLKKGDIILSINDVPVNTRALFEEKISYYRPGDKVVLKVLRKNKILNVEVVLTNSQGTTEILKDVVVTSDKLGASFVTLSKMDRKYYGIDYGIKVVNIKSGLIRKMDLPEGFIILSINGQKFKTAKELVETLEKLKGIVYLKGITPDGWLITRTFRLY